MALNIDRLLEGEAKRVEALQRYWATRVGAEKSVPPKVHHFSTKHFVEMTWEAHRALVEAWGGWRFHGAVGEAKEDKNVAEIVRAVREELLTTRSWATQREIDTLHQTALQLRATVHPLDTVRQDIGGYSVVVERDHARLLQSPKVGPQYRPQAGQRLLLLVVNPYRNIVVPIRVGQRLSAAVVGALEEAMTQVEGVERPAAMRACCQAALDFYTKLFSKLGDAVSTVPFATTLSCAPSSFLRLGESGEASCYRNGGEWEVAKHVLAITPHTVVGLFYRNKDAARLEVTRGGRRLGTAAGRCWGLLSPNGFLVTNFYLLSKEMARESLVALARRLCQGPTQKLDEANLSAHFDGINKSSLFINPDREVLQAGPGFAGDVAYVAQHVQTRLAVHRQSWHDPCCVGPSRTRLLKALRGPQEQQSGAAFDGTIRITTNVMAHNLGFRAVATEAAVVRIPA